MYLYWLLFFIVLAGDYGRTENIYLGNQCYHFMGKIFICKKDANTEALSPLLLKEIHRRGQSSKEELASALPNPWISLLTRKFRLKWNRNGN